ncbi:molybdopterin molybdotransferase MoeA [Streptomyces sp. HPF1205]|uniref:molybdopterin molybdotransferase MoeA n=1 Tax=Streptomyces sp. HPF1205 TaxID=2873262 RepID=UPI001CECEF76|nr:molybdopterin molybdotransferase MoeA [Streptomyces sp. HPF1205]
MSRDGTGGRGRPASADEADRELDDALALANDRRPPETTSRSDPLAVALALGEDEPGGTDGPAGRNESGRPGGPAGRRPGRTPGPGTPVRARPAPPAAPVPSEATPAPDPALKARTRAQGTRAQGTRAQGDRAQGGRAPGTHAEDAGTQGVRSPGPGAHGTNSQGAATGRAHGSRPHHSGSSDMPWSEARRVARTAGRLLGARVEPLGERALGMALARPLVALTDLPSFDASAMDGWAVAGPGPWRLTGQALAGQRPAGQPLPDGHAVRIATGAVLPSGATAVVRSEHGRTERRADGEEWLRIGAPHLAPAPGQEVRRRGQECRAGEELLAAGTVVTPAVLGLAAAAGYDELPVTARPTVDVLVLGDELLDRGLPRDGRVRDALGPMLPSWLRALGAEVTGVRRLVDRADALEEAVTGSGADVIVTTGGTAGGPVDHVHPVLAAIGARLLVDGVAVRPGHPMLLAGLPSGTGHLIGLPGNPLAAVSGVLTLAAPLLRTLAGRPLPAPYTAPLTADVAGHPTDTRLVPVAFDDDSEARPLRFAGPAMLRGLAAADGMAVIPPGGARAGEETAVLDTGVLGGPAWSGGA